MNAWLIILTVFAIIYFISIFALIIFITPLVIFDRKWYKAYYLVCSYNRWVQDTLKNPELEICPTEYIINLSKTSAWKTLFWDFWDFYTDVDVRNSLYRYYNSSDYIDIKIFKPKTKGWIGHEE